MVNINGIRAYIKAIVVLNVVGSSPTGHPKKKILQVVFLQDFCFA
jgi:hypothetical protein